MSSEVKDALVPWFDTQRVNQQAHVAYMRDIQERIAKMSQFSTDITDKVHINEARGLIDIDWVWNMELFDVPGTYSHGTASDAFWNKLPESSPTLLQLNSVVQSNVDFYREILKMEGRYYHSRSHNQWGSALGLAIDDRDYTWIRQTNWSLHEQIRLFHEYAS